MKFGWKGYFNIKSVSSVVRFLTISDVLMISGFGLIAPIFAVFISDTITGGTVVVVGIAAAIFLITRSIGQIPLGALIDRIKGERDDFWFMFFGSIGISLVPLLYLVIQTPLQLYGVQFLYGLFGAMVFPSWMAIFTRHIDKGKEGIEWGVYQTLVDLGSAATASIGGFIAFRFGFDNLFIIVSILSLIGSFFLLGVSNIAKSDEKIGSNSGEHPNQN